MRGRKLRGARASSRAEPFYQAREGSGVGHSCSGREIPQSAGESAGFRDTHFTQSRGKDMSFRGLPPVCKCTVGTAKLELQFVNVEEK